MRKTTRDRIFALMLAFVMIFAASCSSEEEKKEISEQPVQEEIEEITTHEEVAILCTGNILGAAKTVSDFGPVTDRAKEIGRSNISVDIVDCGNHVSADGSGNTDNAVKTLEAMASAGYSHVVINEHEFDFGIEGLLEMKNAAGPVGMSCNFRYSGFRDDITSDIVRCDVTEFETVKIGYVAVTDPLTQDTHADMLFEDGRMAYSFCGRSNSYLVDTIQKSVDNCKILGADYVIILSGLLINEKFNLNEMIQGLRDIDAVIASDDNAEKNIAITMFDGQDKIIPALILKGGVDSYGELMISPEGVISTSLG